MRKKRDVDLLKARLDVYSDEWRTAQPDPITKVKMPTNLTPTGKVRKPRLKKNNAAANAAPVNADGDLKPLIDGKLSKRKRSKSDKVSNQLPIRRISPPLWLNQLKNDVNLFFGFSTGKGSKCAQTTGQSILSVLSRAAIHFNG